MLQCACHLTMPASLVLFATILALHKQIAHVQYYHCKQLPLLHLQLITIPKIIAPKESHAHYKCCSPDTTKCEHHVFKVLFTIKQFLTISNVHALSATLSLQADQLEEEALVLLSL